MTFYLFIVTIVKGQWTTITAANGGHNNFVFFTAGSQVELGQTGSHHDRAKWTWAGWSATFAWLDPANLVKELNPQGAESTRSPRPMESAC